MKKKFATLSLNLGANGDERSEPWGSTRCDRLGLFLFFFCSNCRRACMRMSVRARDAFKPSLQVLCKPVFSLLFSAASFFPFFVAPSKLVRHRLELSC